jgi:hypothetical protein
MNKIDKAVFGLLFCFLPLKVMSLIAQPIPVEILFGSTYYQYQHSLSRDLWKKGSLSFSNVTSLNAFHSELHTTEVMTQTHVSYTISNMLRVGLGTFYSTRPGLSPSVSLQFMKHYHNLSFMVIPRVDIKKAPSHDLFVRVEYRKVNKKITPYLRLQAMTNFGPSNHNRSYQNVRAGIALDKVQFGLALNLDEYGKEILTIQNWGVFFRYELL